MTGLFVDKDPSEMVENEQVRRFGFTLHLTPSVDGPPNVDVSDL